MDAVMLLSILLFLIILVASLAFLFRVKVEKPKVGTYSRKSFLEKARPSPVGYESLDKYQSLFAYHSLTEAEDIFYGTQGFNPVVNYRFDENE